MTSSPPNPSPSPPRIAVSADPPPEIAGTHPPPALVTSALGSLLGVTLRGLVALSSHLCQSSGSLFPPLEGLGWRWGPHPAAGGGSLRWGVPPPCPPTLPLSLPWQMTTWAPWRTTSGRTSPSSPTPPAYGSNQQRQDSASAEEEEEEEGSGGAHGWRGGGLQEGAGHGGSLASPPRRRSEATPALSRAPSPHPSPRTALGLIIIIINFYFSNS